MCVPLLVPRPSLTDSQISETSLSCELTLWCGAVGRDPKPLIRHLNPPLPAITSLAVSWRRVSTPRVQISQTEKRDGTEPPHPRCSWVIYLFMEAFYSHFKDERIIYRSTIEPALDFPWLVGHRWGRSKAGGLWSKRKGATGATARGCYFRDCLFSQMMQS